MNRVLTSAGLLALGAGALYAYDPEMSRQQSGRPFSVAATVRGFYDDNINTSPDRIVVGTPAGGTRRVDPREESFGVQVSPSIHLNLPMEQTFISLGYAYFLNWYQKRDPNNIDQAHEFSAKLRHQFSPRHQIAVDDTFIVTSEPKDVNTFGINTAPTRLRTRGNVFHNQGSIDDTFQLTSLWGLSFGYVNNWTDYEADGAGSRSALLDRIEHLLRADARYQFNPKLVGIVGYSFGFTTFTGDEIISPAIPAFTDLNGVFHPKQPAAFSDDRNSLSHYLYVGVDYDITAKLRASVRVGAQFSEYSELDESSANPYANATLSYTFMPGTSLEAGISHARAATDVATVDSRGRPTIDAEATVLYAALHHRLMRNLTVSLLTQYQVATFNEGASDDRTDNLFMVGVNAEYHFNRHFSAEAGYNYDKLNSDAAVLVPHPITGKLREVGVNRDYQRNRFYVGLKATY
jgi:predicted porin